jgi:hypothetical protein
MSWEGSASSSTIPRVLRRMWRLWATGAISLALLGVGASSVSSAGAEESTAIKCGSEPKKTTEAIEKAVEKAGTFVLECFENPYIPVPKPKELSSSKLAEGFKVPSEKSVTLIAQPGTLPTFENENNSHSRLFTVAKGGSLTLQGIVLSATTRGPSGVSAGKAKLTGEKSEAGESGEEALEEETESSFKKLGTEGEEGADHLEEEVSGDGGAGTAGGSGGFIASASANAPEVQGGAISNAGNVTLTGDYFQGDLLTGGAGGNGGTGGNGGAGGKGGGGGKGVKAECAKSKGTPTPYLNNPGSGGEGGRGGDGGASTPAGNGGEAQGGGIYNTGTLTVQSTSFESDLAEGGYGGNGGVGGSGGNGGDGGFGKEGGDGNSGGIGQPGAAAGSGASGLGGAIYNAGGKLSIEGSVFNGDTAKGGESGQGGEGGKGGKGGGGGLDFGFTVCENEAPQLKPNPTNASGGDGGSGAAGGAGGNGGSAEGGAVYSTDTITLIGLNTVYQNAVEATLGAAGSCQEASPCAGKGGEAGEGGNAGDGGTDPGEEGHLGSASGANGGAGANGIALNKDLFGAASGGEFVEEERKLEPEGGGFIPPVGSPPTLTSGSSSSGSSKSSSSSKGGGDDEDKEDDDKPSDKAEGKATTKQSGSTVKVETGETVTCPAGGQDCTAEATVTISEEMPAGEASSKYKASKPKIVTIGHGRIVVTPGHSAKVVVTLSSKGVALLRKDHHLSAHVTTIVTEPGLAPVKHTTTIPIVQPKPIKHGKKR